MTPPTPKPLFGRPSKASSNASSWPASYCWRSATTAQTRDTPKDSCVYAVVTLALACQHRKVRGQRGASGLAREAADPAGHGYLRRGVGGCRSCAPILARFLAQYGLVRTSELRFAGRCGFVRGCGDLRRICRHVIWLLTAPGRRDSSLSCTSRASRTAIRRQP